MRFSICYQFWIGPVIGWGFFGQAPLHFGRPVVRDGVVLVEAHNPSSARPILPFRIPGTVEGLLAKASGPWSNSPDGRVRCGREFDLGKGSRTGATVGSTAHHRHGACSIPGGSWTKGPHLLSCTMHWRYLVSPPILRHGPEGRVRGHSRK